MTLKTWNFVAAVHNAATHRRSIYVDGKLVAEDEEAYSGSWGTDAAAARIGGDEDTAAKSAAGNCFNGTIDDVRVYERALNASEIAVQAAVTDGTAYLVRWEPVP